MGRPDYLTARCPAGCEAWLHPKAVKPHIELDRCRGVPWLDDAPDAVLVAAPDAETLERVLPPALVARPNFSYDRLLARDQPEYLRIDVCRGITVRSPIADVPARRWVHVAVAAARDYGEAGIRRAVTAPGFAELERELIDSGQFLECPDCHEFVKLKGLNLHRTRNVACRWRRAASEVENAWRQGWRDPYSIPGAPLTWSDLRATSMWRRRLHPVAFPKWTAVLLAPDDG